MGKKLSNQTTEDDLRQLFAEVGTPVSVSIITDRVTGQSKGFGFVEMDSDDAAQQAIQRFNNFELSQRNIKVSEARPQREQSFGGGGWSGGRSGGGGGGGGGRGGSNRSGSGSNRRRF